MAKEITFTDATGNTDYANLISSVGQWYNTVGAAFENFNAANFTDYDLAATEFGSNGVYTADMPSVANGIYNIVARRRAGGSPAQSDIVVGTGDLYWDGTAVAYMPTGFGSLAIITGGVRIREDPFGNLINWSAVTGIAADLPQRVTKNTALAGFTFTMVLSADHVTGATGKTVTATRSLDGGAFASCANAVTEISNGWYKIDLAATDTNGNTVALRFTAALCDDRNLTIITEPT